MHFWRLVNCLVLAILLNGCDTFSGFGADNTPKPSPLKPIKSEVAIKPLWDTKVGSSSKNIDVNLLVAVSANRIFTADPKGLVSAHALDTGKLLWRVNTRAQISSGPVVRQDYILIGTNDGRLLALRTQNGSSLWQVSVPNQILAAPYIDNDRVFVKTIDGKLLALKVTDGRIFWEYDHGAPLFILRGSSTVQVSNNFVIAGFADGKLSALDKRNGKLIWERSIALPTGSSEVERMVDIDADPVVSEGVAYTATYQGNLAAIETSTGQVRWQHDLSTHRALTVDNDQLLASDAQSNIWGFDKNTGTVLWRQTQLELRGITAPLVMGDHVVVGDQQGYLHWLSRDDGRIQGRILVDKSGIAATPVAGGNKVIVLTRDGTLAAFAAQG